MDIGWQKITTLESRDYQCGYCGNVVASEKGYDATGSLNRMSARIYVCPHCARPTFFNGSRQDPDVAPGNDVHHVPDDVYDLYREARNCVSVGAYTASVLISRKLLMNLAVSQGANGNLKFIEYVEYLAENGYVPPNGKGWVDHIRKKGNEATHEIVVMSREDATDLISFSEMLLKFVFEFPAQIAPKENA